MWFSCEKGAVLYVLSGVSSVCITVHCVVGSAVMEPVELKGV